MKKLLHNPAEVKAAAGKFYDALQAVFKGDTGPMEEVWSHEDDVTYLGPSGGIHKGWREVKKEWHDQANQEIGGHVEPGEFHIFQEGDLALTQNYELGISHKGSGTQDVKIRALNVFRKENGEWKMVSHQTDILPFLEKS